MWATTMEVFEQSQFARLIATSSRLNLDELLPVSSSFDVFTMRSTSGTRSLRQVVGVGRAENPLLEAVAPTSGVLALKPAYDSLAADQTAFDARCGDSYVDGIADGAWVLVQATTAEAAQQTLDSTRTSVEAALNLFELGATASQLAINTLSALRRDKRVDVRVTRFGGNGANLQLDDVLKEIEHLPELAKMAGEPFALRLARYEDLANWRRHDLVAGSSDALTTASLAYIRVRDLQREYAGAIVSSGAYIFDHGVTLSEAKAIADSLLVLSDSLFKVWRKCASGSSCLAVTLSPDYEVRARLPLPVGSFPEDVRLRALLADSSRLVGPFLRAVYIRQNCGRGDPVLSCKLPPDEYEAARAFPPISAALPQARSEWARAYASSRRLARILAVNRARCEQSNRDFWCVPFTTLDNALRLVTEVPY